MTEKTKVVFLANPNNPTGTYLGVRRGAPSAGQAARERAAGARRRLCRVRPPQRLRGRPRARRHHRQHSDDAHVLEDLSAWPALRIGWAYCPAARGRCPEPHPRAVQPIVGRPSRPASPRIEDTAHMEAAVAAQREVAAAGSRRRSRSSASRSRRASPTSSSSTFPTSRRRDRRGRRRLPQAARPSSCGASAATACRTRCASPSAPRRTTARSWPRSPISWAEAA